MELIDKAALVAEIEKLKGQLLRGACSSQISMQTYCKEEAYNEVISFLNTLEVKEVDTATTEQLIEAAKTVVRERHEYRPMSIYLLEEALESLGEKWEE